MRFDPAVILAVPVFVLSVVVHECAHAFVAWRCGDSTARDRGLVTLNPLPHIGLLGSLIVPVALAMMGSPVLFGWGNPAPVDRSRLRDLRNDPVRVALAGPLANAVLALAFAALVRIAPAAGGFAPLRAMGYAGVSCNCALALFNLLPIPPLDGWWVIARFLRLRHIVVLHQLRFAGLALVVALIALPAPARPLVRRPLDAAIGACLDCVRAPRAGGLS